MTLLKQIFTWIPIAFIFPLFVNSTSKPPLPWQMRCHRRTAIDGAGMTNSEQMFTGSGARELATNPF
jgi:hypothetical protein